MCYSSYADFIINFFFQKIISRTLSECQTALIQIGADVLIGSKLFANIGVSSIMQVTHVRKKGNIQGRSLNVINVILHTKRNCS